MLSDARVEIVNEKQDRNGLKDNVNKVDDQRVDILECKDNREKEHKEFKEKRRKSRDVSEKNEEKESLGNRDKERVKSKSKDKENRRAEDKRGKESRKKQEDKENDDYAAKHKKLKRLSSGYPGGLSNLDGSGADANRRKSYCDKLGDRSDQSSHSEKRGSSHKRLSGDKLAANSDIPVPSLNVSDGLSKVETALNRSEERDQQEDLTGKCKEHRRSKSKSKHSKHHQDPKPSEGSHKTVESTSHCRDTKPALESRKDHSIEKRFVEHPLQQHASFDFEFLDIGFQPENFPLSTQQQVIQDINVKYQESVKVRREEKKRDTSQDKSERQIKSDEHREKNNEEHVRNENHTSETHKTQSVKDTHGVDTVDKQDLKESCDIERRELLGTEGVSESNAKPDKEKKTRSRSKESKLDSVALKTDVDKQEPIDTNKAQPSEETHKHTRRHKSKEKHRASQSKERHQPEATNEEQTSEKEPDEDPSKVYPHADSKTDTPNTDRTQTNSAELPKLVKCKLRDTREATFKSQSATFTRTCAKSSDALDTINSEARPREVILKNEINYKLIKINKIKSDTNIKVNLLDQLSVLERHNSKSTPNISIVDDTIERNIPTVNVSLKTDPRNDSAPIEHSIQKTISLPRKSVPYNGSHGIDINIVKTSDELLVDSNLIDCKEFKSEQKLISNLNYENKNSNFLNDFKYLGELKLSSKKSFIFLPLLKHRLCSEAQCVSHS